MSRKLKKLFLKHSFLSLEIEEIDEACAQAISDLRDYISKKYPEEYKVLFGGQNPENKKELQNMSQKEPKEEEKETKDEERDPELKKIYRKVVEKSHPDKVGSDLYADVFSKATKAYKDNNIAELIFSAISLGIEIDFPNEKFLIDLQSEISNLEKTLHTKSASFAWLWHLCNSDEDREKVAKKFVSAIVQKHPEEDKE